MKSATLQAQLAILLVILTSASVVRAQGCPTPAENQQFSTFAQWKAVCSRYGTPEGTNLYNAHCIPDPNWCHRNDSSSGSSYTPPPPPDNEAAFRAAEIARQKAIAAEKARQAAEAKRAQEAFERDKADALKDLKGVSSDDLKLKGENEDSLKGDNASFDLKGTGDASPAAMDKCTQRAVAAAAYPDLKQRVLADQQRIQNFNFGQTAEHIQAWGRLSEEARQSYEEKAQDMRSPAYAASLAVDVTVAKHGIENLPVMSDALSEKLIALFHAQGLPEGNRAYTIARRIGDAISREDAEILENRIGDAQAAISTALDAGTNVVNGPRALDLSHFMLSLGSFFSPQLGFLADDLDTVSLATYGTQYQWSKHNINKLTALTEDQLKDLSDAVQRLKADATQLHNVAKLLQTLPLCDSTKLSHQ